MPVTLALFLIWSYTMEASELIEELNAATGLNLTLDEDNSTSFEYLEKQVFIRFLPDSGVFLTYIELNTLEDYTLPNSLIELLDANFMLSDTNGGALSYKKDTRKVALNFLLPYIHEDAESFLNRVNQILSVADDWSKRIDKLNQEGAEKLRNYMESYQKYGEDITNENNQVKTANNFLSV